MGRIFFSISILTPLLTGCTHSQLRYNAVNQARTVSDVHTQQVLDNVAKFVHDQHALPHFSYPSTGVSGVTDSGTANGGFSFNPQRLTGWNFGLTGSRTNNESYTMVPINDPEKLTLMRCTYQQAVSACTCGSASADCPDCDKRFNSFYLGSTSPGQTGAVTFDGKPIYRFEDTVSDDPTKAPVTLIYFPNGDFGADVSVSNPPNSDVVHLVAKDTNKLGEVIYTYLASESKSQPGSQMQLIPVGSHVFKKERLKVTEPEALIDFMQFLTSPPPFQVSQELDSPQLIDPIASPLQAEPSLRLSNGDSYTLEDIQRDLDAGTLQELNGEIIRLTNGKTLKGMTPKELRDNQVQTDFWVPKPLESSDLERPQVPNTVAESTNRSGRITAACLHSQCWFSVGEKCDVPRDCPCHYVGRYCDTYVWVPTCGRDQLTKLTLTILDIANNNAPSSPKSEVYAFIGKDGKTAATYADAAFVAKSTVKQGGSVTAILPGSTTNAEPPNDEETDKLKKLRDGFRGRFKSALEEAIDRNNLFDLVAELPNKTDKRVSFIDSNYLTQSVDVRKGDTLVLLAAAALGRDTKIEEKINAQIQEEMKSAGDILSEEEVKRLVKARRSNMLNTAYHFLDAEQQLQSLSVQATLPSLDVTESPEPTRRSYGTPFNDFQWLNQQLNQYQ